MRKWYLHDDAWRKSSEYVFQERIFASGESYFCLPMNHLAHLFLSQHNPQWMVGNYIADHVKGKQVLDFPIGIQEGIQMHRDIDSFTDQHEIVQQSKERLYPKYHKYAAVLVDMFYDHVLAKEWASYSPLRLSSFTQACYLALAKQREIYPESVQRMYDHMSTHDWLNSYANLDGMQRALSGLAHRASFDSKMDEAIVDLERDYDLYKNEFELFFPKLHEFVASWKP